MGPWKNKLFSRFKDKDYREAYLEGFISDIIAAQLHNLRQDRGWSQAKLAKKAGMKQPRIALLEKEGYESYSINTLRRLANAYEVALIVKFTRFSELARFSNEFSSQDVHIPDYESEAKANSARDDLEIIVPEATVQNGIGNVEAGSEEAIISELIKQRNIPEKFPMKQKQWN